MTEPDPAVAANGVAFAYGERQALRDVSFTVARGERHAFLGPNGSGKSTLFRVLTTLVPPQEGTFRVLGHDLRTEAAAVRRRIGVVFQSPAIDKKLTVRENLRCFGALLGLRGDDLDRRIDALLDHAGLRERHRDLAGVLSGGLRRRVEVCKGLLGDPELLLLDEASTGLDPAARRDLWALLRSRPALTVLFTTHLLDEAAAADRLTLLDEGRVVAQGAPAELVRELGGSVLEIESDGAAELAQALAAEPELRSAPPPQVAGDAVRLRGERLHELVPRIVARFGPRVRRLQLAPPSLEDVFLAATGKRFTAAADAAAAAAAAGGEGSKRRGSRRRER